MRARSPEDWTWRQFDREIRPRGCKLLVRLREFPRAVVVAGCQRSGTTLLGKVLAAADGFDHFTFAKFPELSAALALSGEVEAGMEARAVLQTTYVDDAWKEYLELAEGQKIIWVLRNPFSVAASMLYNWPMFALNHTLARCGAEQLPESGRKLFRWMGPCVVPRVERACAIYAQKARQLLELHERMFATRQLLVIDYDRLVTEPPGVLAIIEHFLDCPDGTFAGDVIDRSRQRKSNRLSPRQREVISRRCLEFYHNCLDLLDVECAKPDATERSGN